MKKIVISVFSVIMILSLISVSSADAKENKKESLNNLLTNKVIYSMKQEHLKYKDITLDTLNQTIQKNFGKPDKLIVNKNNGVTITQNLYTTKNKNKFNFYTTHFKGDEKFDRLRYLTISLNNKNLKFSKIAPVVKRPSQIKKIKNYYEYYYTVYFKLKLKKIDGELYVTNIYYASLDSLPE